MSEAIKLKDVKPSEAGMKMNRAKIEPFTKKQFLQGYIEEWYAEYKGCDLYFSEDRSELRIEKGDVNPEVWRVGEFDKASGKAHYTNDTLGDDGVTGDWSDEDWEQVDEHASRYHIASNRELWREYFDPDENYTDKDWEDEPVKDRVKTMESLAV